MERTDFEMAVGSVGEQDSRTPHVSQLRGVGPSVPLDSGLTSYPSRAIGR